MGSYQVPLPAGSTASGRGSFRGDFSELVESSASGETNGGAAADPFGRDGSEPGLAWLEAPRADEGDAYTVRVLLVDERLLACRHRPPRPTPSSRVEAAVDGGWDGAEWSPDNGRMDSAAEQSGSVRHRKSITTGAAGKKTVAPLLIGLASLGEKSRSENVVSASSVVEDASASAQPNGPTKPAEGGASLAKKGGHVGPSKGSAGDNNSGHGGMSKNGSTTGSVVGRWFSTGVIGTEGGDDDDTGDEDVFEDAISGDSISGGGLHSASPSVGQTKDGDDARKAQTRDADANTNGPTVVDSGPPPTPPTQLGAKGMSGGVVLAALGAAVAEVYGDGSIERSNGEAKNIAKEKEKQQVSVAGGGAGAVDEVGSMKSLFLTPKRTAVLRHSFV